MSEAEGREGHNEERLNGASEPDTSIEKSTSEPSLAGERAKDVTGAGLSDAMEVKVLEDQAKVDPTDPTLVVEEDLNGLKASGTGLLPSPMKLEMPDEASIQSITKSHGPDSPTISLISSLRSQLTLLSDQSTALNAKLIEAIGRHSDLEDVHIGLQQSHKELQERATVLAAEKAQWEESMNTGLLVERSQIKDEMQKLAAGLVEEERRRGSAEERRQKVEEEVDELAASLFDQANTMVAAERMARNQAESRLKNTEDNLAAAESAMRDMQLHLQSLPLPSATPSAAALTIPRRFLASHLPYSEFFSFLQHLRSLRPLKETSKAMFPPPAITTLLSQPFIARAITEDHEPTIRLDAAPDLSYFSRRNVGPAIIAGELVIEPVSANTVISGTSGAPHDINCSLCGKPVFPQFVPQSPSASHFGPPPVHPAAQKQSRFSLKPFFNASASPSGLANSPSQSPLASPSLTSNSLAPVYIFRISRPSNAVSSGNADKEAKVYPLCRTGWCLERLRAACELWHFVRTGIIHPVWHGDDGHTLLSEQKGERDGATPALSDRRVSSTSVVLSDRASDIGAPPLPERKKSGGWGLGFKLGSNEKPSSQSGKWFSRSASNTPPRSPVTPSADLSSEYEKDRQPVLDAPIDLQSPADEKKGSPQVDSLERSDVPIIHQVEASPAAPLGSEGTIEGSQSEKGLRPGVSRSGSQRSVGSSMGGDEATFSTPKGADAELPEDANEEKDLVEEEKAVEKTEEAHVVDLTEPPAPLTAQPTPPPIPRRAANRMSAKPAPPSTESANPAPLDTAREVPAPGQDLAAVEEPAEVSTTHAATPLPPRHPRTPTNIATKDTYVEGEKRYMKVESDIWEEKTWRMVVKLKEGMWKARVGVTDEED